MKILVLDKGLYLPLARKLGEKADKVKYYLQDENPYPDSPKSMIGTGFEEIERIYKDDYPKAVDQADLIVFFDSYDGALQEWLRKDGRTVFGCGTSERLELDRVYFLEKLNESKIAFPRTYRAEGMEDLIAYLDGKENKWLKTSYYRGDFETYHYKNMKHAESWLDDLRYRIGERTKTIEVLIQNHVEAECEIGYDGFCVDGEFAENALAGYEIKDEGYVCKVMKQTPKIMKDINDKISFLHKGCRGFISTELRITKSGIANFIDITERTPSPPNELVCELYKSFPKDVERIANGEMPDMEENAMYGAEIILKSGWYEKHQLYVEFPKEIDQWVKLKNCMKKKNSYYCIPNGNGSFFGAVVAYADTLKKAIDFVVDRAGQIEAEEFTFDKNIFAKAVEQAESGKQYGINF